MGAKLEESLQRAMEAELEEESARAFTNLIAFCSPEQTLRTI